MRSQILSIAIIFLLLAGCKSSQNATKDTKGNLDSNIENKLGSMAERQTNFNKTHVLAWTKLDRSAQPMLRFGVWEVKSGDLVLAGTAKDGRVKWLDNSTLLVEDYEGVEGTNSPPNRYKIEIDTQVRIPIMSNSGGR